MKQDFFGFLGLHALDKTPSIYPVLTPNAGRRLLVDPSAIGFETAVQEMAPKPEAPPPRAPIVQEESPVEDDPFSFSWTHMPPAQAALSVQKVKQGKDGGH